MTTSLRLPAAPYRPRRTEPLGVLEVAGWSVKLTAITADDRLPDDGEVAAAVRAVERHLPQPARTESRPGVAFVIVHRGAEALWVILGRWELDILYHRTFRAGLGTTDLSLVADEGPTACVWELLVIDHERRCWVAHMLARPDDPDRAGYLASTFVA